MNTQYPRVTVVTIIFGDRWKFLTQVVTAVMKDPHVVKLIIVDNGSQNKEEIENGTKEYGDRVEILREEKNQGSAGGFHIALERARHTDCDFVFMLDDDSVPEDGAITSFMEIMRLFPDQKVVLSGSRFNVLENKEHFYKRSIPDDKPHFTFFEVFSLGKLVHFFKLFFWKTKKIKRGPFIPVIPTEGFVYGGAFIPIDAVRKADLPDKSLFLYGDDVEYSWNIKKLGYDTYLCTIPRLYDVDFTFGANSSHIFGQFDPNTAPFRVYYRIRNMVRLSRKHSKQGNIELFLNIFFWISGLFILGLYEYGPTQNYFKRVKLMIQAVYAGYYPKSDVAKKAEGSFFS
ncbi:MAG: glycosyltransferase [Patescibacteria group bacterium]